MNRHIFVVTRMDHLPNEKPKVSIAGSYFDEEQAYENALVLQLQQMIETTSNWSTQAIQRRRDKILNRCRSLSTISTSSYQSIFQYLFPTVDNLFDDLCNVSHQVHGCIPLPLNETKQQFSTTINADPIETPLLQELMTTLQTLLNDEEDLAHSDGEDDDEEDEDDDDDDDVDEEGDEEDDDDDDDIDGEDDADDTGVDMEEDGIDDDSEDEVNDSDLAVNTSRNNSNNSNNSNSNNNDNNDGEEDEDGEDEMDGSDDDDTRIDLPQYKDVIEILDDDDDIQDLDNSNDNGLIDNHLGNSNCSTVIMTTAVKPVDDATDNGNTNYSDTNDGLVGGDSGDNVLLSPPHSDQKQSLGDGNMIGDTDADDDVDDLDEDEIDELNDDDDETPSKRRRTDI